jgi:preprotein translocase subunit SecE
MFKKVVKFYNEIKAEMTKVTWPKKNELLGSTVIVIVISAMLGIFIGIVDLGISKIMGIIVR